VIVTRPKNKVCHDSIKVITNKLSALIEIIGFVIVLQINLEQAVIAIVFFIFPRAKHFAPGVPVVLVLGPTTANLPVFLVNAIYLFPPPTEHLRDAISV
jgi:hypothetical protein